VKGEEFFSIHEGPMDREISRRDSRDILIVKKKKSASYSRERRSLTLRIAKQKKPRGMEKKRERGRLTEWT